MAPSAVQRELMQSDGYDEDLYGDLREDYNSSVSKSGEYTPKHRSAISAYAGPGYKYLNQYLRGGGDPDSSNTPHADKWQQMADLLNEALDQTTTKRDLVTYRGVRPGAIPKLQVGDEITDDGFISTSMDPGEAQGFAEGLATDAVGATVFEVSVPAGTHVLQANEDEHELVLRPGSTFRVVSIEGGFTKVVLV